MRVVVGRIGRAQGLRGEVNVEPRTDEPEVHFAAGSVVLTDPAAVGPLTVVGSRWQGPRLVVRFEGVADRSAAEGLRGVLLEAERDDLARPTDDDEYYDHQLVGLRAQSVAGADLGAVTEVVHLPFQDLLAVRTPDDREVLVPFVAALVPEVDLDAGRVVLDPPGGLFDAEPDDARTDPPHGRDGGRRSDSGDGG